MPELGENEIRIKQLYTGLCASDYHTISGNWGKFPYPFCPGHEVMGIIT